MNIIGRKSELLELESLLKSKEAEFLAVYGRRRIGKTYLIREYFQNCDGVYFEVTGIKDGSYTQQLQKFSEKLSQTFFNNMALSQPNNWHEAFQSLTLAIRNITDRKIVLFFDELPWLATKRSNLLQELDYFWNTAWSQQKNIILVVCGSAASWMLDNLINAKGGLHNRLTKYMLLKPFDLKITKQFLQAYGNKLSNMQILDLYMVTGGVPFYLKQIQKGRSVIQNVNALCFETNSLLKDEFPRLFQALFEHAQVNMKIVREIAKKRYGISREELLQKTNMQSGGTFNQRLEELEASGFIKSFMPYKRHKDLYFKIDDEYTLFYLRWIEPELAKGYDFKVDYWQDMAHTPGFYSWAGYTFESVCMKHVEQIRRALGLQNVSNSAAHWRSSVTKDFTKDGAQIDLLFDRADDAITICELKYSKQVYSLDKTTAKNLLNKIDVFEAQTKTTKQIMLALITTKGLKPNIYSEDLINNVVTLDELFI
ncbi:MAG: AAA family ATPase [Gammaproteobacteria bacterium]|nr:AAA family ATPase [Gammaproteobacteria bacterium]